MFKNFKVLLFTLSIPLISYSYNSGVGYIHLEANHDYVRKVYEPISGTGSAITLGPSNNVYFLTAGHLFLKQRIDHAKTRIGLYDDRGKLHQFNYSEVIYSTTEGKDLALLKFGIKDLHSIKIVNKDHLDSLNIKTFKIDPHPQFPETGTHTHTIYTSNKKHPLEVFRRSLDNFITNSINNNATVTRIRPVLYEPLIKNQIFLGDSGSPIINREGKIVGITSGIGQAALGLIRSDGGLFNHPLLDNLRPKELKGLKNRVLHLIYSPTVFILESCLDPYGEFSTHYCDIHAVPLSFYKADNSEIKQHDFNQVIPPNYSVNCEDYIHTDYNYYLKCFNDRTSKAQNSYNTTSHKPNLIDTRTALASLQTIPTSSKKCEDYIHTDYNYYHTCFLQRASQQSNSQQTYSKQTSSNSSYIIENSDFIIPLSTASQPTNQEQVLQTSNIQPALQDILNDIYREFPQCYESYKNENFDHFYDCIDFYYP